MLGNLSATVVICALLVVIAAFETWKWRESRREVFAQLLFVAFVLLAGTAAVRGTAASQATPAVNQFLICAVAAKGLALSIAYALQVEQVSTRKHFSFPGVLCAILAVLLGLLVYHPQQTMHFQYRGALRWVGPFESPNIYGAVAAISLITSCILIRHLLTFPRGAFRVHLAFAALGVLICAAALINSYSRSAWVAFVVTAAILMRPWLRQTSVKLSPRVELHVRANAVALAVTICAVVVTGLWMGRYAEHPLIRRLCSVTNPNDLSWVNRVDMWEGVVAAVKGNPLWGLGWPNAIEEYALNYRNHRITDLNVVNSSDLALWLIAAGPLCVLCGALYVFLGVSAALERHRPLPTWLACLAICLAVCFVLSGGLFKPLTSLIFLVSVELCRVDYSSVSPAVTEDHVPVTEPKKRVGSPVYAAIAVLTTLLALVVTAFNLGIELLPTNALTVSLARKLSLSPEAIPDFDRLASCFSADDSLSLAALVEHAEVARYVRTTAKWRIAEEEYQTAVLSPVLFGDKPATVKWRRQLWKAYFPKVRAVPYREVATRIVLMSVEDDWQMRDRYRGGATEIMDWAAGFGDRTGLAIYRTAALRSVGVPAAGVSVDATSGTLAAATADR